MGAGVQAISKRLIEKLRQAEKRILVMDILAGAEMWVCLIVPSLDSAVKLLFE